MPRARTCNLNKATIVGRWPPDKSRAALMAAQATHVLTEHGVEVDRWGLPGDLLASQRLAAQSHKRMDQTQERIRATPRTDYTIAFLGPILRNSVSWGERYRRLILLHQMISGQRAALIMPPLRELTVIKLFAIGVFIMRLLIHRTHLTLHRQQKGIGPILQHCIGFRGKVPVREALSLEHLLPQGREENTPIELHDLPISRLMKQVFSSILADPEFARQHPHTPSGRAPAHRLVTNDNGSPATAYMRHLAHVFHRHHASPDPRHGPRLLHWYIDGAMGRLNAAARPVPATLRARITASFSADRSQSADKPILPTKRIALALATGLEGHLPDDPIANSFLTKPVTRGSDVTRGMAIIALHLEHCGTFEDIPDWFATKVIHHFPALAPLQPLHTPKSTSFEIIHDSGETGLARNGRMSRDAITRLNLNEPYPRVRMTRPAMLYHFNADQIPQQIFTNPGPAGTYRIGYLLWEFNSIPEAHRLALEMLDEIWVPTHFVADIYRAQTEKPVYVMGKAIDLATLPPKRRSGPFTALVVFDAGSSVARKNPMAAVRAFQAAFPSKDDDVRLIIKTTPLTPLHWGDPERQIEQIRIACKTDQRIELIEASWPFAQLVNAISAADVLLSPHRAEGFGYMPAFAMALRTPVIATDYSGTRDFVTFDTGFPIQHRLIDMPKNASLYPITGAKWAEVDCSEMAIALLRVRMDPAGTAHKTEAAARLMARAYSPTQLTNHYRARLEDLGILEQIRQTRNIGAA